MIILPANTLSTGGYEVANSCRFNDDDSSYMHITPGGAGNRRTFTLSWWFKTRPSSGDGLTFFYTPGAGDHHLKVAFDSSQRLYIYDYSDAFQLLLKTNRKFRDVSAWYHVVIAIDTTQATDTNRAKMYVNGVQESSFETATYPSADYDCEWSGTNAHNVGKDNSGAYFDGYLAEVVYIDGSQEAVTSFGEFDEDSPTIWKPIDVSGLTFGTNGFYLDFEASDNLGNDANGGTDLTEVNLAATDQATDTPTNNFATLNPLWNTGGSITYAEGNCKIKSAADNKWTIGTQHSQAGYYELKVITAPNSSTAAGLRTGIMCLDDLAGFGDEDGTNFSYAGGGTGYWVENNGSSGWRKYTPNATTNISGTPAVNDIIQVAWKTASTAGIWFGINGTWFNGSATDSTTLDASNPDYSITTGKIYVPIFVSSLTALDEAEVNFGGCPAFAISSGNADANGYGNFEYAVPSGFYALNTKNLAEFG